MRQHQTADDYDATYVWLFSFKFVFFQFISYLFAFSGDRSSNKLGNVKDLHTPEFPVEVLKQFVMEALDDAVKKGITLTRDPIGGSNENLFVWVKNISSFI